MKMLSSRPAEATSRRVVGVCAAIALGWMASPGLAAPPTVVIREPARTALPPEVKVGTSDIIDHEFDWGRDGVFCPTCNSGAGNARLVYFDQKTFDMWVGNVDFQTGNFIPTDGKGTRVTTNIAVDTANGPEWMLSQRGSEIIYTTYRPGTPRAPENMVIGAATMVGGAWSNKILSDAVPRKGPIGSLDAADPAPRTHYRSTEGTAFYYRDVWTDLSERRFPVLPTGITSRRWVPGTKKIILNGAAADATTGVFYKQVFLLDTNNGNIEQLTFDPVDKEQGFFMFQAPEFGNDYVFYTVTRGTVLNIYRRLTDANGNRRWTIINSIAMPAKTPYIGSPEAFVHNGRSYVFFYLSSESPFAGVSVPTRIAMTGIDPATTPASFKILTAQEPARFRSDPEHFITANGPYIYYNRYLLPTPTRPSVVNEGVYRVDTGLGPRVPAVTATGP